MANERTIRTNASDDTVTFKILSEGNEVPRTYHLISLDITREINRIPVADLVFLDGDPANETFPISNTEVFIPGKSIEIKLGYRGQEDTVFKGVVIQHRIKLVRNKSLLIIQVKDEAAKMSIDKNHKYYTDQKDSEIIEEIVQSYGLDLEMEATRFVQKGIVQFDSTDWDFIILRAKANGLICRVEDGKVTVKKPNPSAGTVLDLQCGASVLGLDLHVDTSVQLRGLESAAWNPSDQEILISEASEPNYTLNSNLKARDLGKVIRTHKTKQIHGGAIEEPELTEWSNSTLQWRRLALVQGSIRYQGNAEVKPGQMVQLNGFGDRFSGPAFVSGIRHQVSGGNWETLVQIGYPTDWLRNLLKGNLSSHQQLVPPVHGLHIGIVTQIEGDPQSEFRVLVRIPTISATDDGIWARISTLDAGENRGSFFRPEIGDEVLVGFLDQDPRHPVVLGMFNSSAKPAGLSHSDDNHKKGFITRSDMQFVFHDDDKSIKLSTPAGNRIIISEKEKSIQLEDQHGNIVLMNTQGISMKSVKDFEIKASGNIEINGNNVDIKAKLGLKASGGGGSEFSANGGITSVKGSLVKLN